MVDIVRLPVLVLALLIAGTAHAGEAVRPVTDVPVSEVPVAELPVADVPPPFSDTAAAPTFLRLNTVERPAKKAKNMPADLPPEIIPTPARPRLAPTMGLSYGGGDLSVKPVLSQKPNQPR